MLITLSIFLHQLHFFLNFESSITDHLLIFLTTSSQHSAEKTEFIFPHNFV